MQLKPSARELTFWSALWVLFGIVAADSGAFHDEIKRSGRDALPLNNQGCLDSIGCDQLHRLRRYIIEGPLTVLGGKVQRCGYQLTRTFVPFCRLESAFLARWLVGKTRQEAGYLVSQILHGVWIEVDTELTANLSVNGGVTAVDRQAVLEGFRNWQTIAFRVRGK